MHNFALTSALPTLHRSVAQPFPPCFIQIMRMRELERRTGVHRETIRTYLRLGLLPQPERPLPNQAVYNEQHVEGIGLIRRLRQDSRLTLTEISALIQGQAPNIRVEANIFGQLERLLASRVGLDNKLVKIASLQDQSLHAEADAQALAKLEIISIVHAEDGDYVSLTDVQLILIWAEMRSIGFAERLGFGPELTSVYRQAAEFVAAWEAETFITRTEGRIDLDFAANMLQVGLPLMLNFLGLIRMKAFMRNIDAHQAQQPAPAEPAA